MAEVENSSYVLRECEDLTTRRRVYLGSFFLDLVNVRGLILGAIWKFVKRTGPLASLGIQPKGLSTLETGCPHTVLS